jgi:hypothetical protein
MVAGNAAAQTEPPTASLERYSEALLAGMEPVARAADPRLAYRWFYNGYLIAGANAASYSDSVLEELPSGSYIRETVYTDRAGRRQTVASAPLLVEPTREGSGLRVLRTSLDQRQRARPHHEDPSRRPHRLHHRRHHPYAGRVLYRRHAAKLQLHRGKLFDCSGRHPLRSLFKRSRHTGSF